MKFSQLGVGARFLMDGEPYIKSGPMLATHAASGKSRMIPRYANILPEQGAESLVATPAVASPAAAFEAFYNTCLDLVKGLAAEAGDDWFVRAERELAAARKRYLAALERKE